MENILWQSLMSDVLNNLSIEKIANEWMLGTDESGHGCNQGQCKQNVFTVVSIYLNEKSFFFCFVWFDSSGTRKCQIKNVSLSTLSDNARPHEIAQNKYCVKEPFENK